MKRLHIELWFDLSPPSRLEKAGIATLAAVALAGVIRFLL